MFKVGDIIRIKTKKELLKDVPKSDHPQGFVRTGDNCSFNIEMLEYTGLTTKITNIKSVWSGSNSYPRYVIHADSGNWAWHEDFLKKTNLFRLKDSLFSLE